jgi:hypothetical protein
MRLRAATAAVRLILLWWATMAGGLRAAEGEAETEAGQVLARLGTDRGICVLLGEDPAEMAVQLARQSELIVYIQLPYGEAVSQVRSRVEGSGLFGTRVYVEIRLDPADAASEKPKALWGSKHLGHPVAIALGINAVVVAGELPTSDKSPPPSYAVAGLDLDNGQALWSQPLPAMPVPWGVALDSAGRITVALRDGSACCFANSD